MTDFNDDLNSLCEYTKDRLKQYIYNARIKENDRRLLIELPELSDDNIEYYDNFWRNFKPKFMEIHYMLTRIEKSEMNAEIIGLLRYNYNIYSQVAHNKLSLQIKDIEHKENELRIFYMFLEAIINITYGILIDNKILLDSP